MSDDNKNKTEYSNIREFIDGIGTEFADKTALSFMANGRYSYISYKELTETVMRVAGVLCDRNLQGAGVALLGDNSYEWIVAFLAIMYSGNVAVPLDKSLAANKADELIKRADCRLVLYSEEYSDVMEALSIDEDNSLEFNKLMDSAIEENYVNQTRTNISPDAQAMILFTSGTTGRAKGVPLTHRNVLANMAASNKRTDRSGRIILALPLNHCFGINAGLLHPLLAGGEIFINSSVRKIIKDIQSVRPTWVPAVPAVIKYIYETVSKTATSKEAFLEALGGSIEGFESAGAMFDMQTAANLQKYGIRVYNSYGCTECSSVMCHESYSDILDSGVGKPLDCVSVRIAENGEIQARGPAVFSGYLDDEEDTRAAFTDDGYFKMGDVGHFDESGKLFVTGRIKNLIILSNGENIAPEPIEKLVAGCTLVREVVVYGDGDRIVAEVYPDISNIEFDAAVAQIDRHIEEVNRNLSINQSINRVVYRDNEFPKTSSGKIVRN